MDEDDDDLLCDPDFCWLGLDEDDTGWVLTTLIIVVFVLWMALRVS